MRLTKQDYKGGYVRVKVEHGDDLWVLRSVIMPGDTVSGSTERRIKVGNAKEEKSNVVRKRVRLSIAVEKVDYSADGGTLRVLGSITDGPEDVPRGEHHSFVLEPGSEIGITKLEWPGYLIGKLKSATKLDSALLVLLFDREEAKLYGVTRRGVEELARLKGKVAKKDFSDQQAKNFYKELVEMLQSHDSRGDYAHIVCGAPAFWKEYLEKELPPELKKKSVMTTISAVERTAIRELLGRPEVTKLLAESTTLRELKQAEDALEALGRDKLAYGEKEVAEAVNTGNAAIVLVTEHEIAKRREKGNFHKLEELLKTAEKTRGEVHVLSSDEAMSKIDPLGGVVATKRW
ncbi:pelota family protein [Candidatus Woesearchaeota archaeon]|nr:pelota family protein [Candidatus Woesearchaeota archaeon]